MSQVLLGLKSLWLIQSDHKEGTGPCLSARSVVWHESIFFYHNLGDSKLTIYRMGIGIELDWKLRNMYTHACMDLKI